MTENRTPKTCACTQRLSDLLRAAKPVKPSSLVKVACVGCGKVFWSDSEKEYCFECDAKNKKPSEREFDGESDGS